MLRLFNWIGTRFSVGAAWGFLSWGLPLAALAAGAAGGGWAAWNLGRAPLRMENADLREAHAEATRKAALAGAARLQVAQERSESLATELLETLAANAQLTEEKTHALQTATTGRACLSGRALRVLHGAPGITVAGADGLPPPRAGAAAPGAAPAAPDHADGTGTKQPSPGAILEATDTAVAVWIATAGQQYEACRARLNALIAWHKKPATTATQEPLREPAP
jgi:hypothetical protein